MDTNPITLPCSLACAGNHRLSHGLFYDYARLFQLFAIPTTYMEWLMCVNGNMYMCIDVMWCVVVCYKCIHVRVLAWCV